MIVKVLPKSLKGSINIIASKSLSHRYLIGAALSEGVSVVDQPMDSLDIEATKNALRALGATIKGNTVSGGYPTLKAPIIDAKASGTTCRLLIPVALLQSSPVVFQGQDRLPKRSLEVYEALFKDKQVDYQRLTKDHLPVRLKGPLNPGYYTVRGDVSSQFISGLLFALPLLKGDSTLIIDGRLESKPYVDLTLDVLKQFKIHIETQSNGYFIKGSQVYQPLQTKVEGDYSQAAFFIVAGLINEEPLIINNLNESSIQGDAKIIEIVKSMNGKLEFLDNALKVYPSKTQATTIDLANIPDLGPILMILGALSKGTTRFTHIRRLRDKESDRIHAMSSVLDAFGVQYKVLEDTMEICGQESFEGNKTIDSFNDHRIIMAITIASLKTKGSLTIKNAQHIQKSYPNFFEEFQRLGGDIEEEYHE